MENLSQLVALCHVVSLLVPGAKRFRCKKLLRAVSRLRGVMEIPAPAWKQPSHPSATSERAS